MVSSSSFQISLLSFDYFYNDHFIQQFNPQESSKAGIPNQSTQQTEDASMLL
jgi:hypothetical protein